MIHFVNLLETYYKDLSKSLYIMTKMNIVLIIGQNKDPINFKKSLDIYLNNEKVSKIVLVTWNNTTGIRFNSSKILCIKVPPVNLKHSFEYQKKLFDVGVSTINNRYNGDIYILKTRMDFIISNDLLNFILEQDYKLESSLSPLFKYKIWIAWIHVTKPFYIGDCCFYSHISVINNLAPQSGIKEFRIRQGHPEIRWFLTLSKLYNIYDDPSEYHKYKDMAGEFELTDEIKKILLRYKECINKHFIVQNFKDGILGRDCASVDFYKKKSNNILDIIQDQPEINNKKFAYNIDDFNSTFESSYFISENQIISV